LIVLIATISVRHVIQFVACDFKSVRTTPRASYCARQRTLMGLINSVTRSNGKSHWRITWG